MEIMLINPGREHRLNLDARASAPPLGLLYVASNIIEHGNGVKVIDQLGSKTTDSEIITAIKRQDSDLIGFSCMGEQVISAGRITDKIKQELPNSKVLWGGINPTFNAHRILNKYRNVDFCIRGEGEQSTIELIDAMKNKKYENVHGLVYRERDSIKEGLPRKLIEDLDSIPFPDRTLIKGIEYGSLSGLKVDNFTSILSSRGCPYDCKYCCCSALVNKRWRGRKVEKVLDELEVIQNQGYNTFLFFDDGLTINNKRVIEMCKGMRRRGLDLDWFFEGRVDNAGKEVYEEAVKAGAKLCYFGAESATQKVLNYYNKRISPEQTQTAIKTARKAGMDFIIAAFILGCPGEKETDIKRTISFMKNIDVDFVQVTSLHAYPGTALWESLISQGYINPDNCWEMGVDVCSVHPQTLPTNIIYEAVEEAYKSFISNYKTRIKHVWRLAKSKFRRRIFFHNFKYFTSNLMNNLVG